MFTFGMYVIFAYFNQALTSKGRCFQIFWQAFPMICLQIFSHRWYINVISKCLQSNYNNYSRTCPHNILSTCKSLFSSWMAPSGFWIVIKINHDLFVQNNNNFNTRFQYLWKTSWFTNWAVLSWISMDMLNQKICDLK